MSDFSEYFLLNDDKKKLIFDEDAVLNNSNIFSIKNFKNVSKNLNENDLNVLPLKENFNKINSSKIQNEDTNCTVENNYKYFSAEVKGNSNFIFKFIL